ncbi:hypothetical protein HYQ19_gp056 [Arthrobacter phage DrYang]|uniref:Uncharacterized protein n=1 Tax=Arthrobacter phage DrYang TaxID=2686080 RepID=A0A6B9J7M6_9CAUD|nr:hypothetical protein HYQ19_gp056 [Arthrobacter phage DrYang]QGZ17155.1 hypothetical protein SEA_DRYANG_56 [Arthrobacter phage DrYang]
MKPYNREAAVDALADMINALDQFGDNPALVFQECEHGGVTVVDSGQLVAENVLVTLHPIIENQEQLDALGIGSVVIDSYRDELNGDVYRSALSGGRVVWFQAGPQGAFHTIKFPAMVLHKSNGPSATDLFLQGLISE